jgi:hypothetical protein
MPVHALADFYVLLCTAVFAAISSEEISDNGRNSGAKKTDTLFPVRSTARAEEGLKTLETWERSNGKSHNDRESPTGQ